MNVCMECGEEVTEDEMKAHITTHENERAAQRKVRLLNGPAAGKTLILIDNSDTINVPVIRSSCRHETSIAAYAVAVYKPSMERRITYAGEEPWVTDFNAAAVGYWCQQCEMEYDSKYNNDIEVKRRLDEMKKKFHQYVDYMDDEEDRY